MRKQLDPPGQAGVLRPTLIIDAAKVASIREEVELFIESMQSGCIFIQPANQEVHHLYYRMEP